MALDYSALNDAQEEMTSRTSGDGLFVYGKDINKTMDVRVLPPRANLKGRYFLELITYWINGVKYISPATFGLPCPITREVDAAKESKDKELKSLLEDRDNFQKKYEYLIPILVLDVKLNDRNEVIDVKVKDNKAKVLSCGTQLNKRINKVACSRKYMNGTEDGFTDRVEGYNLILSKVGEKLNTEYDAEGDVQWEMDEKYYNDYPDVYEMSEKSMEEDDYLEGVIRNYLYGEPMPVKAEDDKKDTKPAARNESAGRGAAKEQPTGRGRGTAADEETGGRGASRGAASASTARGAARGSKAEEEKPKEEQPKAAASGGKRNLLKDLENLDA